MEKAIAVGIKFKNARSASGSLEELIRLAETAGAAATHVCLATVDRPHPATFIGSGKAAEIAAIAQAGAISSVIFDEDITPAQQRNLEQIIPAKIIDRTRLILDIFAQRARTREGKLQVELAQLSYMLPRLTGRGTAMMQQHGGIGTRGPGERKLEYDRRRIKTRIARLSAEIDAIKRERQTQRKNRSRVPMPQIVIVGYTNAGKSTLLNCLTGGKAGVYADNLLFATLDPTTRRVALPSGGCALFTDTVGFIQKLPHSLVAAFRATLEEIADSDCIVHVHDATSRQAAENSKTVSETLKELQAEQIPVIEVYNKADELSPAELKNILLKNPDALCVSALRNQGIRELLNRVEQILAEIWKPRRLTLPAADSGLLEQIYKNSLVTERSYTPEGNILLKFKATEGNWRKIAKLAQDSAERRPNLI